MSDQLKYIVEALNKPPFSKSYNLISFDSLQSTQLLQVLNDVFATISPQQSSDLREEDPEQRVLRMFAFLRTLQYKPPKTESGNVTEFRQGLVQGDKSVVYPMLHWLLERLPELTKRAYLGRFLIKLDVPSDMLIDAELSETSEMYLGLIEQFKESHKTAEQLKESSYSIGEIKRDIVAMEEEQEQLRKRIERMQKRTDSMDNRESLLQSAQLLRLEKEKEANLNEQRSSQKSQLIHTDQKINRLGTLLKDLQTSSMGISAEGLIKRLQEENQVNSYLCQEKIPEEIKRKEKYVSSLQSVAHAPAVGKTELDQLNKKIGDISSFINSLVEKRIVNSDPMEDNLSVFRQQAAVIANKKTFAAEKLQEAMEELSNTEEELLAKKQGTKGADASEILKGEEFKRYVNKLRTKSTLYKKKRAQVAELKAELGVLKRTQVILAAKCQHYQSFVSGLESQHGILGFHQTQEELETVSTIKSEVDEQKGKTLEDMSQMVLKMNNSMAQRKSSLAPLIKELRPLRLKAQEMNSVHADKKSVYETTAAGLESNMSKLEQEVKGYREQSQSEESRYWYLHSSLQMLEAHRQRIDDELKVYKSAESAEKKKSLRETYSHRIHEQEILGKALREKQKTIRDTHSSSMKQAKMWTDLSEILKCKLNVLNSDRRPSGGVEKAALEEQDHLVL